MNNSIKVIVIEDDPMVSRLNKKYTEKVPGFSVCEEININNNMNIDYDYLEDMDLLLLDIFLPGKDGLTILKEIREFDKCIDVIVISAAKDVEHINEAMHLGVLDYLIKPFTFERFKKSLEKYREIYTSFNRNKDLNQKEIDSFLGKRGIKEKEKNIESRDNGKNNKNNYIRQLPKGLCAGTFSKIMKYLKNIDKTVTTKDMAEHSGLSRITIQRYFQYMLKENIIEVERKYGSVGRPQHHYKLVK